MSSLAATAEEIPEIYQGLGGRGLTSHIIDKEVIPACDPLGAENKLVFSPGILGGTIVPCSGRLSVGAKSPLTKGIKEANAGGSMAQKLARLGIKALVIEDQAKDLTYLGIDKSGVKFLSASSLCRLGNYALLEKMKSEYGSDIAIACIGPAGEMQLTASAIILTTPDLHIRAAARGGLGAVMGSKNLKAIVVDDTDSNEVEVKDQKKLIENVAILSKAVLENHFVADLRRFGTSSIVMMTNTAGALPTKNYSAGQFDKAEDLSGERMEELLKKRPNAQTAHHCMDGCIISCSNVYTDENGELIVSGIAYETIALIGANCLIGDLDYVARINRVCNDAGVDTVDVGGAIAVAMEAGLLQWGDGEAALRLTQEIAKGTENGRMIGNGVRFTGEKLGVKRIPHVKGQGLSGYDPRMLKGVGVTFATSPMGADHTAGMVLPGPQNPAYDPTESKGQGKKSQYMQSFMVAIDTLGLCMLFGTPIIEAGPELLSNLIACVSAVSGEDLDKEYLFTLGSSVLAAERRFNASAGLTKEDDRLPRFFSEESALPGGPVFDVPEEELDQMNKK